MSRLQTFEGDIDAVVSAIDPQNNADATSDVDGNSIDRQSHNMPLRALFYVSHNNAQSGDSFDYTLQESSDNSTWSDVSGVTFDTISDDPTDDVQHVDLTGRERYIRLKLKSADATLDGASVDIQATCVLGGAKESADPAA